MGVFDGWFDVLTLYAFKVDEPEPTISQPTIKRGDESVRSNQSNSSDRRKTLNLVSKKKKKRGRLAQLTTLPIPNDAILPEDDGGIEGLLMSDDPVLAGDDGGYRAKIQSLKREVGDDWLKVLLELNSQKNNKDEDKKKKEIDHRKSLLFDKLDKALMEVDKEFNEMDFNVIEEDEEVITNRDKKVGGMGMTKCFSEPGLMDRAKISTPGLLARVNSDRKSETKVEKKAEVDLFNQYHLTVSDSSNQDPDDTTWQLLNGSILQSDQPIQSLNHLTKIFNITTKLHSSILEFKASAYASAKRYIITGQDAKSYKKLLTQLTDQFIANLKEGRVLVVYKRGECLDCGWIGYLNDITTRGEELKLPKGVDKCFEGGVGDQFKAWLIREERGVADIEEEGLCLRCKSDKLVEFFGLEVPDHTVTVHTTLPSPPTQPQPQSLPTPTTIPQPITLPQWYFDLLTQLPSHQSHLPPFRSLTNKLKLYLSLTILEGDDESILSWHPVTFLNQPDPTYKVKRNWFYSKKEDDLEVEKDTGMYMEGERSGYLLLSDGWFYLFGIKEEVELGDDQIEPSDWLQLVYKIPLKDVIRMDLGGNRQLFTLHFQLYSIKTLQSISNAIKPDLPTTSLTILMRCKNNMNVVLDELIPVIFDQELKKFVNHDILWLIYNLRSNLFLNTAKSSFPINGIDHVQEFDPASSQSLFIDKVTFDFLKCYSLGYYLNHQSLIQISIIVTDTYLYVSKDRLDVWPPPLDELTQLDPKERVENHGNRLKCQDKKQFDGVLAIALNMVEEVEMIKSGLSMNKTIGIESIIKVVYKRGEILPILEQQSDVIKYDIDDQIKVNEETVSQNFDDILNPEANSSPHNQDNLHSNPIDQEDPNSSNQEEQDNFNFSIQREQKDPNLSNQEELEDLDFSNQDKQEDPNQTVQEHPTQDIQEGPNQDKPQSDFITIYLLFTSIYTSLELMEHLKPPSH